MNQRWLLFVDGENFTCRGQEVAVAAQLRLVEPSFFERDQFLWIPTVFGAYQNARFPAPGKNVLGIGALRVYHYTSVAGDDLKRASIRSRLWDIGFEARVVPRTKSRAPKGVHIALMSDMLSHAFRGNYGTAVLVAADGDYVALGRGSEAPWKAR
jgi:hypothetical protein